MRPLFPFLLGVAATAIVTTDAGRRIADTIGETAKQAVKEKISEAKNAIDILQGKGKDENGNENVHHE